MKIFFPLLGRIWLVEGGANFAATIVYSEENLVDWNQSFTVFKVVEM